MNIYSNMHVKKCMYLEYSEKSTPDIWIILQNMYF